MKDVFFEDTSFSLIINILLKPLHCIALRTIRYSDKHSILTAYSRQMGRISLLVPAGKGKTASRYRALTMPMAVFECQADIKPGREIHPFRDLKLDTDCLQSDFANPVRSVLAVFLADFFISVLKEPVPDNPMFSLLRQTSVLLWNCEPSAIANLHILTLIRTAEILGIFPDISTWRPGYCFNMTEGIWVNDIFRDSKNILDVKTSHYARHLLKMDVTNFIYFRFNRKQRQQILELMLKYFASHGFTRDTMSSMDILKELF